MAISDNELNSLKNQWNNLSYADQQAKLSSNSKLQWALNSLWLSVKSAPTSTTTTTVNNSTTTNTNTNTNRNTGTNNNTNTNNTASTNSTTWTSWSTGTNNAAWYNQVKPEEVNNRTRATNSTVDNLWYQWDKLTYEQQQEKFNQTPALRTAVEKLWLRIKWPNDVTPTNTTSTTNTGTTNTGTTWNTGNTGDIWKTENTFVPWSEWDYQDNSQARMDQIANNLSRYRVTNPELFENRDDFYNFFIKDKGRSQDQIDYLWSYYDNVQKYWKYDTLTPNEIWAGLVDWTIPQDYLNWLKATDPAKYTWVGEAMKDKQDEIMNESYLNTIMEEAGLGNQTGNEYSDMTKWAMKNWLFVDKNGDWTDDWLYPEASDEEKKLWKADSEYEAEKLKLTNAMKDLQSDLTDQYPDADLSTIMLLTADRWQKIQKALDTIAVSQTRTQWEIKYMQNERDMQSKARQNTISNLQKAYGMYYDYTPEWMSELAQAKYAATNVTLDQADNGTDTQKQMALQNVLDWYYSKYWDIIERSEQQVINDVMALAKSKGMSLNDALEENFLQHLRAKPGFKQLNTLAKSAPETVKAGDDIYQWNWTSWELVNWKSNNWTNWLYGFTDYTPVSSDTLNNTLNSFMKEKPVGSTWWECWSFVNDYLQKLWYDRLYDDPIDKKKAITNTDTPAVWAVAVMDSKKYPQYWHTAIVTAIQWDKVKLLESNWNDDHQVHERWVDKSTILWYFDPSKRISADKAAGTLYNPDLAAYFEDYNTVWDDQLNKKRFWEWESWKSLKNMWISQQEFLKQYNEYYAATTKDAFLDLLKNIDILIEETWPDFSVDEESAAMLWAWTVGNAYKLIKDNATVQWLADAKAKWLKLWVLSDSDVRMIANASSSMSWDNWDDKWRRDLIDFRNKILSKNKYLKEEYGNKSAYSPNTAFSYDPNKNYKITVTKWKATTNTNSWGNTKKSIKDLWNK